MKLHHFITAQPSEAANRVRDLGKALSPAKPLVVSLPEPVVETQEDPVEDNGPVAEPHEKEAHRRHAHEQAKGSKACHHVHVMYDNYS
jgi:hypothetical protein